MKIPITKPFIDDQDLASIRKPLENGWLVQGPCVKEFEAGFAEFIDCRFAIANSNCTASLHMALEALGIHEGDHVVVPSFTYVASANVVEYQKATVQFCDIDLGTFNMSTTHLREIVERDTQHKIKAIMAVHLFGLCADMEDILNIAKERSIPVIEDAACATGSMIGDRHCGTFGKIGCFSFHPRKVITTGEGGMLTTNDESIAQLVYQLRDHGAKKSDFDRHVNEGGSLLPDFDIKGFNYRMTDMQGALGVTQMHKLKDILKRRKALADRYYDALKNNTRLACPFVPENFTHSYQSYVCLWGKGLTDKPLGRSDIDRLNVERNHFMKHLEEQGISTRQGTHAIHTLGYYKKKYALDTADCMNAYAADRLSIALPLYPQMMDSEFDYVIDRINQYTH